MPEIKNCLTIEGQMNVAFCSNKLDLRYTDYNDMDKNFLRATLNEAETTFASLPKREWETIRLLDKKAQQENRVLIDQNRILAEQNENLTKKISNIYASKTWKTGKLLKHLLGWIIPRRK